VLRRVLRLGSFVQPLRIGRQIAGSAQLSPILEAVMRDLQNVVPAFQVPKHVLETAALSRPGFCRLPALLLVCK
jgi:hypothetical protein